MKAPRSPEELWPAGRDDAEALIEQAGREARARIMRAFLYGAGLLPAPPHGMPAGVVALVEPLHERSR